MAIAQAVSLESTNVEDLRTLTNYRFTGTACNGNVRWYS
jgi:hypothetical protein